MLRRIAFLLLLAPLLFASVAYAGGWVTVTLDEVPFDVAAHEPLSLGFTVRQHGQTPTSAVEPFVLATHPASATELKVMAMQQGSTGHFVADLQLTRPGTWQIVVHPAPFPVLDTQPPLEITVAPRETDAAQVNSRPRLWGSLLVVGIAGIASFLVVRRQEQRGAHAP